MNVNIHLRLSVQKDSSNQKEKKKNEINQIIKTNINIIMERCVMKTLTKKQNCLSAYLFVILFFLPNNLPCQEWVKIEPTFDPPGTYHFFAGEFFNENIGWVIDSDNGKILNSNDGGLIWEAKFDIPQYALGEIFKLNEEIGWIIYGKSDSSVLLQTSDAGETWQELHLPFYAWRVFFVDDNFGFTMGDTNYYKTIDGGNNWDRIEIELPDTSLFGVDMFFLNKEQGWILARYGFGGFAGTLKSYLLKTNDGGNNWNIERFPQGMSNNGFSKIAFVDSLNGVLTEFIGSAYYTTDGGSSWIESQGSINESLDLVLVGQETGWSVGRNGKINLTTDTGRTWQKAETNITNTLYSLSFINNTIGYAFGSHDALLKYENVVGINEESYNESINNELLLQSYPNPVNSITNVSITLPQNNFTKLTLFNVNGEKVKTIHEGHLSQGNHNFSLELNSLSSGLYICNLQQNGNSMSIKILLLK